MKSLVFALALLSLSACVTTTQDPRVSVLTACETFYGAVDTVAGFVLAGKFSETEKSQIKTYADAGNEICQGDPMVPGTTLQSLNDLIWKLQLMEAEKRNVG